MAGWSGPRSTSSTFCISSASKAPSHLAKGAILVRDTCKPAAGLTRTQVNFLVTLQALALRASREDSCQLCGLHWPVRQSSCTLGIPQRTTWKKGHRCERCRNPLDDELLRARKVRKHGLARAPLESDSELVFVVESKQDMHLDLDQLATASVDVLAHHEGAVVPSKGTA
eukprot:3226105-Amphidinium_carterae.2